jgi:glucokinase
MKEVFVGIDIGGTKTAISLVSYERTTGDEIRIVCKSKFSTPVGEQAVHALDMIKQNIDSLVSSSECAGSAIKAIGISCGGPVDSTHGIIKNPPNLYGWFHVPIVDVLQEKYKCNVYIQNDANACALAEWHFGAGKNTSNMVFLTMGTGMGAGLILNKRLYCGTNDMAGEIGHVRLSGFGPVGYGKIGSFEGFTSGFGIAQIARDYALVELQNGRTTAYCDSITTLSTITAKSVAMAARNNDAVAIQVYLTVGEYLGKGLSVLIDILNPEMIVIGSIYARDTNLMVASMQKELEKEALPTARNVCKVVPAALGECIGDYAALTVALYGEGYVNEE